MLGLCLFADSAYTYFGAVFIIATAVTQLEFLQTLAAIIRGNKDYFDFMTKVTRSSDEAVLRGLEDEVDEIEKAQENQDLFEEEQNQIDTNSNLECKVEEKSESLGSNASISPESEETDTVDHLKDKENQQICIKKQVNEIIQDMDPVQLALIVEEKTFKLLERKHNGFIARHVRFKESNVEIDGLMNKDSTVIIFEIQTVRKGILPLSILSKKIQRLVSGLDNTFKEHLIFTFVFVGNFTASQRRRIMEYKNDIKVLGFGIEFDFYTFEEIGLSKTILDIYESNRKLSKRYMTTKQGIEG